MYHIVEFVSIVVSSQCVFRKMFCDKLWPLLIPAPSPRNNQVNAQELVLSPRLLLFSLTLLLCYCREIILILSSTSLLRHTEHLTRLIKDLVLREFT